MYLFSLLFVILRFIRSWSNHSAPWTALVLIQAMLLSSYPEASRVSPNRETVLILKIVVITPRKTTAFKTTIVQPKPIAIDPRRVSIAPSVRISTILAAAALPKCCQKVEISAIAAVTKVNHRSTWYKRRKGYDLIIVWDLPLPPSLLEYRSLFPGLSSPYQNSEIANKQRAPRLQPTVMNLSEHGESQ